MAPTETLEPLKHFSGIKNESSSKIQNSRLKPSPIHTFRHWKQNGYNKRIIFHVRNFSETKTYETQQSTSLRKTLEEACKLVEVGFKYDCSVDYAKIFRKRR